MRETVNFTDKTVELMDKYRYVQGNKNLKFN